MRFKQLSDLSSIDRIRRNITGWTHAALVPSTQVHDNVATIQKLSQIATFVAQYGVLSHASEPPFGLMLIDAFLLSWETPALARLALDRVEYPQPLHCPTDQPKVRKEGWFGSRSQTVF